MERIVQVTGTLAMHAGRETIAGEPISSEFEVDTL
jgi:histone H3/H4